nr:HAD family hydrolase [Candidatus Njordarchaeum guaymaensis]
MKIPRKKQLNGDNVELLLIDMDGTLGFSLIPEELAISSAIRLVTEEVSNLAKNPVSEEEVRRLYKEIKDRQYKLYPLQTRRHDKTLRFRMLLEQLSRTKQANLPPEMINKVMQVYWRVFEENAAPYPQTHSTLEALKRRHKVIIITNNGKEEGERKRKIFGLEYHKHYDLFITSEELGETCKPSGKYFDRLVERIESSLEIDVDPKKAVIIGDDPSGDIALANMCSVPSIRVKKDLHSSQEPKNDLERASVEINELNELLDLF